MFASEFGGKISNIRLTALPEKKKSLIKSKNILGKYKICR